MVFSSLIFLYVFLPLSVLLYFLIPGIKRKNVVLLLFSLLFYGWGEPVYILLMVFSIVVNYYLGCLMEDEPEKKKHTLIFALVLNLFILGFFKYYGFLLETVNGIFGTDLYIHKLALPIGISFYTFQTLSYIIDLYRGKFKAQRSVLDFGVYISMYFQLIAGPIVRYETVEKELHDREISFDNLGKGTGRFMFGLGKKVLIANLCGAAADYLKALPGAYSVLGAWLYVIAYTLQIYFDFSGYSDMAIGLGTMFGFHFPENFDAPYLSTSVTMFWRRWHISLGTWFREYVYIPLGGNRVAPKRHILNILIVWALTGLWHGASWNFVLWGVYYGALLLFEKYVLKRELPKVFGHIVTVLLVMIGWVLFSAESMGDIGRTLGGMCGIFASGFSDVHVLHVLQEYGVFLLLGILCCMPRLIVYRDRIIHEHPVLLCLISALILFVSTAFLVSMNYNPFLYFRF